MVKAVIFDVDGTLIDSVGQHAKSWRDAFRDFGHEVGFEALRAQIGKGGDELMPVFLAPAEIDRIGEKLQKARARYLKDRYFHEIKPFADVRALFERLIADGYTIALASSASGDDLTKYKEIANIGDLLTAETSSDDAEKSKPNPDIFKAALQKLNILDLRDVFAIGDTPYDALSAGQAGLQTIGFLCGGWSDRDLRAAGCIATFENPRALLADYDRCPLRSRH